MSIGDWLLNPAGLTPHGFCLSWQSGLIWLHAGSDAIIGLAYLSVPLALASFARKRSDFEYSWVLYIFVVFIVACGVTHIMSVLTLWIPVYGLEGIIKLVTALASVAAAIVLWPLVPKLLAIPSPAHLRRLNSDLAATIAEQRRTAALLAESDSRVRAANLDLEQRVNDQTAELRVSTAEAEWAASEAERANLAKSKFLAAASHDLRQPVQSLTLLLSVIGRQVANMPKAANTVEMAKASTASLNAILTGMLDISRLDAGVITPSFASVDLGELVHRLALEYAPRAAAVGLVLRHAPRAFQARADAVLLERILRNLIENALRYTAKGGVLIGLRQRGDHVRIDVIDTGMGIAADHQTEIFEEFRQLNNPARDSSKGLGLGLAIVSRLARLLDIQIELASRLGRGTRFSLLLPVAQTEAPVAEVKSPLDDDGGRILVIEDNPDLRQVYELMLSDWGYQTISAANGEEALELAAEEKWRFDAILADYRLGAGLSGTETAKEIACKANRTFPTLVLTGDTAKERIVEIEASGFIMRHKPVEADDLRRALASLLSGVVKSSSVA
jgi:signal transduction histidine kinase/ActR/RegA family two-component response regulator